ncbi:MAG: hypothetical protein IT379_33200, partial [Deltaproteobacteria bacterium]|nr:hypothetical protein [Deltaproteobacteria bacterium]
MTKDLAGIAADLCRAVDGVDWDAPRVQACVESLHRVGKSASREALDAALATIAARVSRARIDDADGVAHAAISGGALVEWGARPRPLGEALLAQLPGVLVASRRFADACVGPRRDVEDPWDGIDDADVFTDVDGIPITWSVLRSHLEEDRAGAAALSRLREWVLPTIATLSRDRELLVRAKADRALRDAARAMESSEASCLRLLLATELSARWRLVLPGPIRVLELQVDALSSNFDLHALVERALARHGLGIPDPVQPDGSVSASLELLVWSGITLVKPSGGVSGLPLDEIVWREGVPSDVPEIEGMRTLVATKAAIGRSWRAPRPFAALVPTVTIERELPPGEA